MTNDFIEFLKQEIEDRKKGDPTYSIRRLAEEIDYPNGPLSQIIARTRKLSVKTYEKLSAKFDLTRAQDKAFRDNVKNSEKGKITLVPIAIDSCQTLAILEALRIEKFAKSPSLIAKALSISEKEVKSSINELIKKGAITKNGTKITCQKCNFFLSETKREDVRDVYAELPDAIMKNSARNSAYKFAYVRLSSKRMADFRKEIDKVYEKFLFSVGEKNDEADSVYQFNIALSPKITS